MREMTVSAILVSDIHITDKKPVNRTDDYMDAQETKLAFINGLAERYEVPVMGAGDIFDKWRMSPFAISMAIRNIKGWYTISGNHDLPYHNHSLYENCCLNVLEECGQITNIDGIWKISPNKDFVMFGVHYGYKIEDIPVVPDKYKDLPKLCVIHEFVWKGKVPFPGCKSPEVEGLMRKLPQFDCIHVGDNHDPFTHRMGNQLLVNAGSTMRSNSNQHDFKPRVYLWDASTNEVDYEYLPIEDNVFEIAQINKQKDDNKRLDAFVENLADTDKFGELSFVKNVRQYMLSNDIDEDVKVYINKAIGEKE